MTELIEVDAGGSFGWSPLWVAKTTRSTALSQASRDRGVWPEANRRIRPKRRFAETAR